MVSAEAAAVQSGNVHVESSLAGLFARRMAFPDAPGRRDDLKTRAERRVNRDERVRVIEERTERTLRELDA